MPLDYSQLIARAWDVFTRNRVLWLLALMTGLLGFVLAIGSNYTALTGPGLPNFTNPNFDYQSYRAQRGAGVSLFNCLWYGLAFLLSGVYAASEAAMIATADHYERTREPLPFAQAWGLGWRKLGPVWLVSVLVLILLAIVTFIVALPFVVAFGSAFVSIFGSDPGMTIPTTTTTSGLTGLAFVACGCGCVLAVLAIPVLIALYILRELAIRAIVLENQGVGEALGTAWRLLRAQLGPTLITFLIGLVTVFILYVLGFVVDLVRSVIGSVLALDQNVNLSSGGMLLAGGLAFLFAGVTLLLGVPFTAFGSVLWTVFYRNRRELPNSHLGPGGGLSFAPAGSPGPAMVPAPPPYTPPPPGGWSPPS